MANTKISELSAVTALAGTDVFPVVDVSASTTNKVSVEDLLRNAPDGSANAPSIANAGDQDTGILFPAADSVGVSTGGTQRLVIDSSGNCGIGAAAPAARLDVAGNQIFTSANPQIQFNAGGPIIRLPAANTLAFLTDSSTERLRIDSSGRVGIGTTSPSATLHVKGSSSPRIENTGTTSLIRFENSSAENVFFGSDTTNAVIYTQSAERLRIDSSGNLGVGLTSLSTSGFGRVLRVKAAGGAAGFFLEEGATSTWLGLYGGTGTADSAALLYPNTGSFRIGTTSAVATTGFSEKLRIDSSGNVGIGTTSPALSIGSVSGTVLHAAGGGTTGARFQNTGGTSIEFFAGSDAVINTGTSTNMAFYINGSEKMRLDSSGNLGIGAASPAAKLDVAGNQLFSAANPQIQFNAGGPIIRLPSANTLAFLSDNTNERMRIDGSGRLLVGHSSDSMGCNVQSATTGGNNFAAGRFAANNGGPDIVLRKSRNATVGSHTIVQDGDDLGNIFWGGSNGSAFKNAARITAQVDGTPGTGDDMPGRLTFSTSANGASIPTERMRISNNGFVDIPGVYDFTTASAANVNVDSTGGLRRSTSSSKYKTNIETLENSYADAVLNCRPVWYRSTTEADNPEHGHWGFIAEEVAEIDPRLVHWKTVEVTYDENGSVVHTSCDPEPEGVAYDRFVPHLLNLIKRQQSAIETLEAKVAALEAQ